MMGSISICIETEDLGVKGKGDSRLPAADSIVEIMLNFVEVTCVNSEFRRIVCEVLVRVRLRVSFIQ